MKITLYAAFVLVLAAVQPALAVQVNLDTPRTELTLKPGQTKRVRIKLINHEERPVRMRAFLQDVTILPDGSPEFGEPGSTPWSLVDFSVEAPSVFILPGRSQRIVGLKVTVPDHAKGGRYGALVFESEAVKAKASNGARVNVNVRLASLILIDVKGTEVLKAEIRDLTAWREKGEVHVKLSVANTGNVLIRPQGHVQMKTANSAAGNVLNVAKTAVLPGQTKDYVMRWPERDFSAGRLEVASEVDFGGKDILGSRVTLE